MRMCNICEANPVTSDGKCLLCLKDAAGAEPEPKINPNKRQKTPRGVRTSPRPWGRQREQAAR